jgi:hypothetical protein
VRSQAQETPRSEVSASLRDLNSGSNRLPWTIIILSVTSASGQRVVIIGPGVVCSRDANGCSGRGVRKRAIAAKVVSKRLGAGGVGKRASGIARATKVWSGGGTKVGGIGSGCASDKPRQLTWMCVARASAQHLEVKIFRHGGANDLVATNISMSSMNNRAGVFAAWRAAWLCVACWIGSRVTGHGVGVGVVNACRSARGRRTHREHVFADSFSVSASVKFPDLKRRRERAGVRVILRPPFPFFDIWEGGEYAHAVARRDHAAGGAR